jgi:hypothetical protein
LLMNLQSKLLCRGHSLNSRGIIRSQG